MARFIFVTGGVVSSLGKGLLAASLGALLQARGFKVRTVIPEYPNIKVTTEQDLELVKFLLRENYEASD